MTSTPEKPNPSTRPGRRWSMIALGALVAFLVIGGIIGVLAAIDAESSPASGSRS
jgi:hypothetical protein